VRTDLAAQRRDYTMAGLSEADLAATWPEQFDRWLTQAAGLVEPNAVVLSTADAAGLPSARTVLLKDVDERGLVVFTNLTSRKGRGSSSSGRWWSPAPWSRSPASRRRRTSDPGRAARSSGPGCLASPR
jgi:pyridoxamine 5'-phosphate oxidase